MKKQLLLLVIFSAVLSISTSAAFAAGTLEINTYENNINPLDSIIVVGTISGASIHNPVLLTVLDPNGDVLYKPSIAFDGEGKFSKLFHPPITGFKPGVYTVIASQKQVTGTAELQFTVIGDSTQKSNIVLNDSQGLISIQADAVQGSSMISISGITQSREGDVTVKVSAPNGNLISIDQVTPSSRGQFSLEIVTGGPLWGQDGQYTVTAYQGSASELTDSIQVEIQDGVVVPEFGTFAILILSVSILSIILITTKSRNLMIFNH